MDMVLRVDEERLFVQELSWLFAKEVGRRRPVTKMVFSW